VNFDAPDFQNDLKSIAGKLDSGFSLDSISNLPQLSEFSELAKGLLPQNLIKEDENGKLGLPSLTELQQALSKGLGDVKGYLEKEITGVFQSLKGEVEGVVDEGKKVYEELANLGSSIQNAGAQVSDAALEAFNGATGLNVTAQDLGNLQATATNTIESFSKLSPKKLKSLQDPNFFGRIVDSTLNTTLDLTGMSAEMAAMQSLINEQIDSSAYTSLFQTSIESSKNVQPKEKEDEEIKYKTIVYRTVYWGKGEGALPEAAAKKANSGNKLKDDYSLAVDNSKILVGSKVTLSDDKKEREAVDVATPSKGITISETNPTLAIYFDTKEKAQAYLKSHPERNVVATVVVPSSMDNKKKQEIKKKIAAKKKEMEEKNKKIEEEIKQIDKKIEDLEGKIAGIEAAGG
jgi:DNA-binding transcriptional MerR regulator